MTHRLSEVTNSSTIATAYVTIASHRGITPVRSHIVPREISITPAMRSA